MCGICGVAGVEKQSEAEAAVRRMMAAMRHRGPDDEGTLVCPPGGPRVALGMRRLSIIDVHGGKQPIWNESRTLAVIFNGEIYNFRELRKRLEATGHRFETRSDTEAIVHAYEEWGEDCPGHLRGMFAFAVLELPEGPRRPPRKLFLARDRLGIKPLYYTTKGPIFLFASEVRALLVSGFAEARLSAESLFGYLLFGSVVEPATLVGGVFSLPPGHRMTVSLGEHHASEAQPYWTPALHDLPEAASPRENPAIPLRKLLEEAVQSHLVADVPVGVFLSSGVDSTALAALASREQKDIRTFTVIFPEHHFSEAKLAGQTAKRFSTRHQEFLLSGEEMRMRLDEAVAGLDQPSMDGINTYFVSWAARQAGLKVALSGLGSDEIFGGYPVFRQSRLARTLAGAAQHFPKTLQRILAWGAERLGQQGGRPDAGRKIGALLADSEGMPDSYFLLRALFTPGQVSSLLRKARGSCESSAWWNWLARAARESEHLGSVSRISWLEIRSYLLHTLLRDTDAMSMHHSLEVRVPFLDHPVVEFVLALPDSAKRSRKTPKGLLVKAVEDLLPREVVAQRKRTFTLPWEGWLQGALRPQMEAGLEEWSPLLEPLLRGEAVCAVWKDFLAGRTTWSRPWSLYVLNTWVRTNLERRSQPAAEPRPLAAIGS